MDQTSDITQLLAVANDGDPEAMQAVLGLLYDRLREIAHRQLAHEAEGHTLETDGLVHEAYLRLLGVERVQWRDRQHLLATAARMMRRVLIDYADRRKAQKRGGGEVAVVLDEGLLAVEEHVDELRALDEALERLEAANPRHSRVVEYRFFAGLSIEETAEALKLSPATVKRDWIAARAWLNRELES
ncbi:MAG: sigma-70 family RNA polymerase sigma factor [Gemmatimonadaceae bacterium]|nr:sigma-70 family RNA polymerase sigma factor [Gemmatimonadaceae bacterium]MDQ3516692.1 ECF-type sigma factor [Gemmatimonadota bacterium]